MQPHIQQPSIPGHKSHKCLNRYSEDNDLEENRAVRVKIGKHILS